MKKRNKRRLPGIPSWMWVEIDSMEASRQQDAVTLGLLFVIALSVVVGVTVVIGGM